MFTSASPTCSLSLPVQKNIAYGTFFSGSRKNELALPLLLSSTSWLSLLSSGLRLTANLVVATRTTKRSSRRNQFILAFLVSLPNGFSHQYAGTGPPFWQ